MKAKIKRYIIIGLGWFFIILGIAGLFLPVVQGVLFLLLGLYLLSLEYHWARKILSVLTRRFPYLQKVLEQVKNKQKEWFRRLFGT